MTVSNRLATTGDSLDPEDQAALQCGGAFAACGAGEAAWWPPAAGWTAAKLPRSERTPPPDDSKVPPLSSYGRVWT